LTGCPELFVALVIEWIKKGIAQHERGEGVVYADVDQIVADRR
jgi:hypothetical protein